ncbi:MAG: mechanosensitive ion channel [Eubacterium sp.]|nr:mechanosensitive ion channel [Eubacterium sp.]
MIIPLYIQEKIPKALDLCLHLAIALLLYYLGTKIIKLVLKFTKKSFLKSNMEEGVSNFLFSIIKIALYFVLILTICQFLGLATSSVIALLGSAGLAVGLALQGSLANFAGGVLILIAKPFVVGDYIIVGDQEGKVISIDIIYTKLQMVDNKIVIMPNGALADSNIINVTDQNKRRIDIEVAVDYSEDIKRVRDILKEIIERQKQILPDESVDVVVGALNTSSVDMLIHVWVKKEDYWTVRWEMLEEIKERFDEEGIVIPFNQLDVNVRERNEHGAIGSAEMRRK